MNIPRDEDFLLRLGARIRTIREKNGMSLEDLGAECGLERNTIYRIENGKVNTTVCTLKAIAEGLGTTFGELCKKL